MAMRSCAQHPSSSPNRGASFGKKIHSDFLGVNIFPCTITFIYLHYRICALQNCRAGNTWNFLLFSSSYCESKQARSRAKRGDGGPLPALTCDADCEIISAGHLADGFSLKLLHVLWLSVGRSVSMPQLPVQLGAPLHILQDKSIW